MTGYNGFFHYFPVNEEVLHWGAYVTGAGRGSILPQQDYPPLGHPALYQFDWRRGRTLPEFQLVLLTDGGGEFESEVTGPMTFEGPTLVLLFPGVWHRYRPSVQEGWTERWLSYNGDLVHRLYGSGLLSPTRPVCSVDAKQLAPKFDDVLSCIHADPVCHTAYHSLRMLCILAHSVECIGECCAGDSLTQINADVNDPVVELSLEVIWTSSHRAISVVSIARALSVSRRTLDRRFRKATGRSVLEEINVCRLTRAKRLLIETNLSIRAIANLVGFSSSERMCVLFARSERLSPRDFRRRASRRRSLASDSSPRLGN